MKKFIFAFLFLVSSVASADNFNPYNQQYTVNQNYGVSNWMTAFGPGINTAAVTLIGGLVNAMSRPDPVVVQQPQQVQYVNGNTVQNSPQQGQQTQYPQQYQNQGYAQQAYPVYGNGGPAYYGQPMQGIPQPSPYYYQNYR